MYKRCIWAQEEAQTPEPCKIMRFKTDDQPVMCKGYKAMCLGLEGNIYDIRDTHPKEE